MSLLDLRLTTQPNLRLLLDTARQAITAVLSGQLGHAPTDKEWATVIGKAKEEGGLGLTGKGWDLLVKQIVENRLYTNNARFRVIVVNEGYCGSLEKVSLNIMAMDLAVKAFEGKPQSTPLIT